MTTKRKWIHVFETAMKAARNADLLDEVDDQKLIKFPFGDLHVQIDLQRRGDSVREITNDLFSDYTKEDNER